MSALEDYAAKRAGKPGRGRQEWTPPTIDGFIRANALGLVLAVDQSLASCGLVVMNAAGLRVTHSTIARTEQIIDGPEDTLLRGDRLEGLLIDFIASLPTLPSIVVHELPPVISPRLKISRPESSWIAAAAVRSAARVMRVPTKLVAAQKHKKWTCGVGNADKKYHHDILMRWAPEVLKGTELVTNVDERDALSIAISYAMGA